MSDLSPEAMAELLAVFREEARANVEQITQGILGLERASPGDLAGTLADAARRAHNIKGAAGSLGLEAAATVIHAIEQGLLGLRTRAVTSEATGALLHALDWVTDTVDGGSEDPGPVLAALATACGIEVMSVPQKASSPAAGGDEVPRPHGDDGEWVRVPVSLLESVLSPLSVLIGLQGIGRQYASDLDLLGERLEAETRREVAAGAANRETVRLLRDVMTRLENLRRSLRADTFRTSQAVSEIEDGIRRARTIPLQTLGPLLARAVRDAERRTGKDVAFALEGGEVGVDRRTIESMRDGLVHLVRNAVDHGIESAEQRASAGKPARATVRLVARTTGQSVLLEVVDDGGGVNVEAVRRRAVESGLFSQERARDASQDELFPLLFAPGFSTAKAVTELSGRGVGLDVVARSAESLGGDVAVESRPGRGTTFRIKVPMSLVSTHVFLVRAAAQLFALPASSVELAGRLAGVSSWEVDGGRWLDAGGRPTRLASLIHREVALADSGSTSSGGSAAFVVLTGAGQRMAFEVAEILGEADVVIEPLGPPLGRVPGTLGATILGSGAIVVVLNPVDLVASASPLRIEGAGVAVPSEGSRKRILVADDSITSRTLLSHILESRGFDVQVAHDGVEALEALRLQPADLVISDVEMPRLDGIGLTSSIRGESALAEIPVILVTSLGSDSDRRRGLAAGANAYLVKTRFDQDDLLAAIRRIIG